MSEVNKKQTEQFFCEDVKALYRRGTKNPAIGTEIESWIVRPPRVPGLQAEMMTPADSQQLMRTLSRNDDASVFSEVSGSRAAGRLKDAPVVCVETGGVSYQLELSGVFEAATRAYPRSEINTLLKNINRARWTMSKIASDQGLMVYPLSVLGSATIEDCEANMVDRERLRSEWQKFKSYGADSPGLRTMGLAASVQVSLGYRNEQELREIMRLSNLLSPLLTAVFANNSGFIEGEWRDEISRPRWWLEHNAYAPRAGVPDFMMDVMFGNPERNVVDGWFEQVMTTPMVYCYDETGKANFSESPTFKQLQERGMGTLANFYLAESLLWPNVKLIGGKRVELRMCDSGPWQAYGLTIIAGTLFATEEGRRRLSALLKAINLTPEGYREAQYCLAKEGLDTPFGSVTLRELVPPVLGIVLDRAREMKLEERYLAPLVRLRDDPVSDFERWRAVPLTDAAAADAYFCRPVKADMRTRPSSKGAAYAL